MAWYSVKAQGQLYLYLLLEPLCPAIRRPGSETIHPFHLVTEVNYTEQAIRGPNP
jgi:hypothetical protein